MRNGVQDRRKNKKKKCIKKKEVEGKAMRRNENKKIYLNASLLSDNVTIICVEIIEVRKCDQILSLHISEYIPRLSLSLWLFCLIICTFFLFLFSICSLLFLVSHSLSLSILFCQSFSHSLGFPQFSLCCLSLPPPPLSSVSSSSYST